MTTARDDSTIHSTAGYVNVNGLRLYFEIHGNGHPVVLLHGGLLTIDSFGAIIPSLASTHRQVIAVELQGHGHTADTERELTVDHLAGDVVALLDDLRIERADLFGFSLGGTTALRMAMRYPDRVGRQVVASAHFRSDGFHPEIRNPRPGEVPERAPTAEEFRQWQDAYTRVAPDPQHFLALAEKVSATPDEVDRWSEDELRAIEAPTLLVVGDNDFVRLDHAAALRDLIPGARLAVLPGTVHTQVLQRTELLLPLVESHLSEGPKIVRAEP